jgi:hypothetical protein
MPRPRLDKRKPSKSVTLNDETIRQLTTLGKGNLSLGIESAFQGYLAFRAMQGMGPIINSSASEKNDKNHNKK